MRSLIILIFISSKCLCAKKEETIIEKCLDGPCDSCLFNTQCINPSFSRCLSGNCVKCTQNSHCQHILGRPKCQSNECVCLDDSDCATTTPYCISGACKGCTATNNVCDTKFPGLQYTCGSNGKCSPPPIPDPPLPECSDNTMCGTPTPICNSSGSCVECTTHTQCIGSQNYCYNENCQTCTSENGLCQTLFPSDKPYCSEDLACVRCTQNSHCPSSDQVCQENICIIPDPPEDPDPPENPSNPGNPDDPENSDNPEDPGNPDTPEDPENSDSPEDHEDPSNPDNPDDPENSDNPEDPEDPENPDSPEDPENSDNPQDPEDPSNPDNPDNPDTPEDPDTPENPEPTVTPEPEEKGETPITPVLDAKEVEQVQEIAGAASTAGSVSDTGGVISSMLSPTDPTSMAMGSLTKMLQYIKYMEINFPPKVQVTFENQESNTSMNTKAKTMLSKYFIDRPLPENFEYYKAHSSFIVNLWQSLLILAIIYAATMLLILIYNTTHIDSKVNKIAKKILPIVKWNVFLVVFCGTYGDIVFFSALEFQSINFDSFPSILSFAVCIGLNALAILIFIKIIQVNLSLRRKGTNNENGLEKYKAFFECYKTQSFNQQIYLAFYILRTSLFNVIIAYIHKNPLHQAILILLLNFSMVAYLVFKKPMKKRVNLLQHLTLEVILLVFNTCLLILAMADNAGNYSPDLRRKIGDIMMTINLIVPMVSMGFVVGKLLLILRELYLDYKSSKVRKLSELNKLNVRKANRSLNNKDSVSGTAETQETIFNQTESKVSTANFEYSDQFGSYSEKPQIRKDRLKLVPNSQGNPQLRERSLRKQTKKPKQGYDGKVESNVSYNPNKLKPSKV